VLPPAERRSVGPFIFFDQMGPGELAPGSGIDVRPHPQIGLAPDPAFPILDLPLVDNQ
jgi:redox-sensitive bicupin YhaK (pirin superfamily)